MVKASDPQSLDLGLGPGLGPVSVLRFPWGPQPTPPPKSPSWPHLSGRGSHQQLEAEEHITALGSGRVCQPVRHAFAGLGLWGLSFRKPCRQGGWPLCQHTAHTALYK